MEDVDKWGTKNLTKWAIIERAPFTASGLNEVWYTIRTKREAENMARLLRLKVQNRNRYQIVKYPHDEEN